MREELKGRKFSFEISGFREGRWMTDQVREDEAAATRYARSLLQSGYYEEIKIVRHRDGKGTRVATTVLHEKGVPEDKKPLTVGVYDEQAIPCETLEDFTTPEARMSLQGLLQSYLDRYEISAIELVHNATYIRKLNDDHPSLLMAALHKVAIAQAAVSGQEIKDRVQTLSRLIEEATKRTKAITADRNLPKFNIEAPDESWAAIRDGGGDEALFRFEQSLTRFLFGFGSQAAKIENLLAAFDRSRDAQVRDVLDSVLAELFSGTKLIDQISERYANRAESLGMLADVLTGRTADDAKIEPMLLAFSNLAKRRLIPRSVDVVSRHLTRYLATGKPLDPRSPEHDEKLFDQLMIKLRDADGRLLGGLPTQRAVAGYKLKHRQRNLRRMGMDDAADALAKSWDDDLIGKLIPLVK